jgi:hypothetical protein
MRPQDSPQESATSAERRGDRRRRTTGKIKLRIDAATLEGELDNISPSGVLFFTGADLRVSVLIEENGQPVVRTGRLVRAQRVRPQHVGWAIEFD